MQEVAANIQQAATPAQTRSPGSKAEAVARRYFEAIDARDLDAAVALWADGGRENVRGQVDVTAPTACATFIGELLDAVPDLRMEIVSTTTAGRALRRAVAAHAARSPDRDRSAASRRPAARSTLEGFDLLTVRDGLIQSQRRVHRHDDARRARSG